MGVTEPPDDSEQGRGQDAPRAGGDGRHRDASAFGFNGRYVSSKLSLALAR